MATKNSVRLRCNQCSEINYVTRKNVKKNPDKLNLCKFCSSCRCVTQHQEIKRK